MEKRKVSKMMMVTVEEEVFPFSELSEEAKAVAIENRRKSNDFDFWSFSGEIIDSFKEIGAELGFSVSNYCYDLCGYSYTSLRLNDSSDLEDMDVRRTLAYVWNHWIEPYLGIHKNSKGGYPTLVPDEAQKRRMRWSRDPKAAYWNGPFSGENMYDGLILETYDEFSKEMSHRKPKQGACFHGFLKVLGEKMTKTVMDEAEFRNSDEGISEELIANDVLFLADGSVAELAE